MKVLSLFDGMACGMLALMAAEIPVDRYVAFEIDKYAVQTTNHNFPVIEQRGDVFEADFTEFEGFDVVLAGFPCTKFSVAQKKERETEPYSGEGWLLFEQAWRAVCEAKPKYFLFENNKSMAKAVQSEISKIVGFEPDCINSALVSAQTRNRLYWVGKRNEDGTYSNVEVSQPEDKGILLKDILDGGFALQDIDKEPVCVAERGRYGADGIVEQHYEPREDGKTNVLTTVQKDNQACEPVRVGCLPSPDGTIKNGEAMRVYSTDGKGRHLKAQAGGAGGKTGLYAVPCKVGEVGNGGQGNRIYSVEGKSVAQTAQSGGMGSNTGLYAIPVEFDGERPIKAISYADGKEYPVYEVKDGQITIKGKTYPIKLKDGFYIIRKLTVRECVRLQTVPEWYEFPVSDSQAYKLLGNGWTVDVIVHILSFIREGELC